MERGGGGKGNGTGQGHDHDPHPTWKGAALPWEGGGSPGNSRGSLPVQWGEVDLTPQKMRK